MGSPVVATLAYGFDLGNSEKFLALERDKYGGPAPSWYDDEGPEFVVQLYDALYAAIPGAPAEDNADKREAAAEEHFGVQVDFCGTDSFQGWVLIAVGSRQEACNADVLTLNLFQLQEPPGEWNDRLHAAVEALGITPTATWPAWLVYPSYDG